MKRLPPRLLLSVVTAAILLAFIQVGILHVAFDKLGLAPESASLLVVTMLFGSFINVPLFSIRAERSPEKDMLREIIRLPEEIKLRLLPEKTVVAVNVGGCLTPVCFCLYLLLHVPLDPWQVVIAVATVSAVAYGASFPVPKVGIVMPFFVTPIAAALVGMALDPDYAPALAYIAGTLGVLIGADVLHLGEVKKLGGPLASIGGGGTFDGIFITGVIAVLLA